MHDDENRGAWPEPAADLDRLAATVVAAATEVHRWLGPGFLECVYEEALAMELQLRQVPFARQVPLSVHYKGSTVGESRIDLLVDGRLIVELKAIDVVPPIHHAQVISYLRTANLPLGLLINFNVPHLLRGVKRLIRSL